MTDDVYTHGHHDSVLRSHRWRTAANSAAYLLPHLRPGMDLLDAGCGPGTITVDLARRVAPGRTLGVDREPSVVAEAERSARAESAEQSERSERSARSAPAGLVEFATGDVYALDLPTDCFDVVHAHQVLQHLSDPVAALAEWRRVLRPGGWLAVRDSDYAGFVWAPHDRRLDRWLEIYHQVCTRNGADADAGRHLPAWVRAAGYTGIQVSSSTWTFADPEDRRWWGELWGERAVDSSFAAQAVEYGFSDRAELQAISEAWRGWAGQEGGVFVAVHVEVLAHP